MIAGETMNGLASIGSVDRPLNSAMGAQPLRTGRQFAQTERTSIDVVVSGESRPPVALLAHDPPES